MNVEKSQVFGDLVVSNSIIIGEILVDLDQGMDFGCSEEKELRLWVGTEVKLTWLGLSPSGHGLGRVFETLLQIFLHDVEKQGQKWV